MNQEFVTRRGLISQGGITFPYVGVTTTYSISSDDYFIECTSSTFNVTLPTAVGIDGKIYVIKNSDTGVITVDTTSSETIDGVLTKTLNQYDSVIFESNGTNWVIVGDSGSVFSLSVDNGLSLIGSTAILGGTISQTTVLHGEGYDLIMSNFDNLYFTSSVFDVESDFISLDSGDGSIQIISGQDIVVSANDVLTISATSGNVTTFNLEGLVYTADYNATFVTHSLIDKQYVDSLFSLTGGSFYIEVTYGALLGLISSNSLGTASNYLITDYQTVYLAPDYYVDGGTRASSASTGPVEPILVTALSCNSLEVDAYQPAWPLDTIKYDVTQQSIGSDDVSFGTIIERVDEYGNRTDYDHRNVLYKRYQSYNRATNVSHSDNRLAGVITDYDCTTGDVYGNGTLFLSQIIAGDIILIETSNYEQVGVKVTNVYSDAYMTVQVDSSYSGTIFSVQSFEYYSSITLSGLGPESYCDWKEVYVGQSDNSEFTNRYTFDFGLEMKFFGEVMSKNNFINNHEGLLYGSGFVLSNIVFGNSSISNTIGNYSFNNTFPIGSSLNTIGDLFNSNTIYGNVNSGSQFNDNRIDNNFERNTIFGVFKSNQIGNGFTDNYINSKEQGYPQDTNRGFSFNTIGVSDIVSVIFIPKCFNQNKIMGTFRDNTIDDSFYKNKIYNFFSDNKIGGNFNENQIGNIDFLGGWSLFTFRDNTIGNDFLVNTLYNSNFNNNTIGNGFNNNIIRDSFYSNQIGNEFGNNKTNKFEENQIGSGFDANDTFYFTGNKIGNGFKGNRFGDNTRWGWNDLSNISVRNFNSFSSSLEDAFGGDFRDKILFEELVMLDVVNNKYYRVKFNRLTSGGSGFSYERTEIDSVTGSDISSTVYFTKTDSGFEVDVISSGVLEITIDTNGIYNSALEGSYSSGVSPTGTLWNSRYTVYDSISGLNTWSNGCFFVDNKIGNYFQSNVIRGYFGTRGGNTIGDSFDKNIIRLYFVGNTIGNSFAINSIKDEFISNSIGNDFSYNYIKDRFKNNEIQNNFERNYIDYDFYSNEIQNDFYNNEIGYDFHGNSIGSYFKYNQIGAYAKARPASFYDNVIGNYFGTDLNDNNLGNNIRTLFFGNNIGRFFSDNYIFENFESNQIGNGFFQNLINDGFYSNIIGEDFQFNIMDSNFAYNNIGDEFTINVFGKNCVDNVIGNLCLLNIVGNRFDSNRIGNIFAQNTISDNFTNNNLGDLNTNNIIGVDFIGNNTGLRFQLNLIQDNFEQNNIRNNFESNYILNNFLQNDIDDDFKLNVVGTSSVYGNSANFEKNVIGHSFISNKIGQGFKSNQIKDYFLKNEIGYAFKHNVIGSYFGNDETTPDFYFPVPFSNRIKDFFNNNNIGDYFGYDHNGGGGNGGNLIGTKFNFNTIGHGFIFNITYTDQYGGDCMSTNTIGNDFTRNVIKPHFNFNTIGHLFSNNDIDSDFTGNNIPYFFYSNTIGKYFATNNLSFTSMFNNIKDGFESNHIGDSFIGNFINIGCARNFIGDLMGSTTLGNTIGKYFIDNTIGNNFRLNTVGNKFQHNKIGNFFEGNDIDVRFQYNQIGDYFGAKQNVFFSFYTPTGNVTKEDFVSNKIGNYFGNDTNYPSGSGGEDGGNLVAKSFKNNTFGDNVIFNVFDKIFQWNEFGNEIWYNALGEFCRSNKIGNLFVGNHGTGGWPNVTGNFFTLNTIGDITGFNMIRRNFQHNKIGNRFGNSTLTGDSNKIQMNFQRNVIGDHFGSDPKAGNNAGGNYIEEDFMDNHIGNLFLYNTIQPSYQSNHIANYFIDNNIGIAFSKNHIIDGFEGNQIENFFYENRVGYYFHDNIIKSQFHNNEINGWFRDNNILDYFSYNKIVTNKFFLNTIDSNFKQNIIETEINSFDFTTYNGEILTYTLTTSNTGTTGTYTGLTPTGPSSLSGTGATFDVVVTSGVVSSVSINTSGKNYVTGNTFGIDGTYVGGVSGTDDVIITINNVRIPSVYATYSCHIIERYDGVKRLTYYNASDALTVTNINI